MPRSRPKLTFTLTDESFTVPPGSQRTETVGACWAPALHLLADYSELQLGHMKISSLGDWFTRVKTLVAQATGVTAGAVDYTDVIFNGISGDAGVTSGGAIGLLNGSPGAAYTINIVAGSSGGTLTFLAASNFRQEWWSVQNFLQYGGDCFVGFIGVGYTGALGAGGAAGVVGPYSVAADFASPGIGYDVVFQSSAPTDEWTSSTASTDVTDIVSALEDSERPVVGVISVGVTGSISSSANIDVGSGANEYIIGVAGSKYHLNSVASTDTTTLIKTNLAPDIAGCIVRADRNSSPWISPAGPDRGKILSVVKLSKNLTTSQQDLLYDNNVNPVITIAGQGTMLYGDITNAVDTSSMVSINVIRTINYIKSSLMPLANSIMFGQNNESTRNMFKLQASTFLGNIQAKGGLLEYIVVCDDTNNPTSVIESKSFNADISVKIPGSINYINISLTNK